MTSNRLIALVLLTSTMFAQTPADNGGATNPLPQSGFAIKLPGPCEYSGGECLSVPELPASANSAPAHQFAVGIDPATGKHLYAQPAIGDIASLAAALIKASGPVLQPSLQQIATRGYQPQGTSLDANQKDVQSVTRHFLADSLSR